MAGQAQRQQVEIGHVGQRHQPPTKRCAVGQRETLGPDVLPAIAYELAMIGPSPDRLPDITENGARDRGAGGRPVGSADRDLDGADVLQAYGERTGDRSG